MGCRQSRGTVSHDPIAGGWDSIQGAEGRREHSGQESIETNIYGRQIWSTKRRILADRKGAGKGLNTLQKCSRTLALDGASMDRVFEERNFSVEGTQGHYVLRNLSCPEGGQI